MMASPVVLVLVAGHAVVECDLAGETALGQQFQRTVHRGEANPRVAVLNQVVQVFGREVVVSFKEGSQDRVALLGMLQPDTLQMAIEYLLGLPN